MFCIICYYLVANINAIIWLRKLFVKYFFRRENVRKFEAVDGNRCWLTAVIFFNAIAVLLLFFLLHYPCGSPLVKNAGGGGDLGGE
jgi:hypothetical protein